MKRCVFSAAMVILAWTFFPGPYHAESRVIKQEPVTSDRASAGDVLSGKRNPDAVKRLDGMEPGEVRELDSSLSRALGLYYDGKYDRAYPLFRKIAAKMPAMDVMYWLAMSARAIGEFDVAVENFNNILAIDPHLPRVRMELAEAYMMAGRYEEAGNEIERLREGTLSPGVRGRVERLSTALEKRGKIVIYSLRISQGVIYDDNISASADRNEYETLEGVVERNKDNRQLSEVASVSRVAGSVLYDPGDRRGFMWNTKASFYNKSYFDYSRFNYMKMDLTTAPWWAGERYILKLPLGYTEKRFGNDRLGYTLHAGPDFRYDFNRYFGVRGAYLYEHTDYSSRERSDLDNDDHRAELAPIFLFADQRVMLSPAFGYHEHHADRGKYSYDGPYFSFSGLARLPFRTDLVLGVDWFRRKYDKKALPLYDERREDKQWVASAGITKGFCDYFYTHLSFHYIHNSSNLEIYDYDRMIYCLNLEFRF